MSKRRQPARPIEEKEDILYLRPKSTIPRKRKTSRLALLSPCCNTRILSNLEEGIIIGICQRCRKQVMEIESDTGKKWWTDANGKRLRAALKRDRKKFR